MDGGSAVSYLTRTPLFSLFMLVLGLLDFQGRPGGHFIVRWNLRLVIFSVEESRKDGPRALFKAVTVFKTCQSSAGFQQGQRLWIAVKQRVC